MWEGYPVLGCAARIRLSGEYVYTPLQWRYRHPSSIGAVINVRHVVQPRAHFGTLPHGLEGALNKDTMRGILISCSHSFEPTVHEMQAVVSLIFGHPMHGEVTYAVILRDCTVELNWFPAQSGVDCQH